MSKKVISKSDYLSTNYVALHTAWKRFKDGKRPSGAMDEFAYNLEVNLMRLSSELSNGSYKHGGYKPVVLHEKKRRNLAVATVRDRIVHRLLYDYLVAIYDKGFDGDVWSCRVGKGLHACLDRTQKLPQKHLGGYVWRADITKFYDNVVHATLLDYLHRKISWDENALYLLDKVINSYSTILDRQTLLCQGYEGQADKGIPIGNLTSQIFSNIYLHEFDRFIRHRIKPLAYIRYGDDFAVFCPTRHSAYDIRELAASFLRDNLGLTINPKNDVVIASRTGLKFLGHNIHEDSVVIDDRTTKSVLHKLDWHNAASYRALLLAQTDKASLDWILLEKYVDVQ